MDYGLTKTFSEGAPIDFNIEGNTLKYIDLSKTLINVKAKITKGDSMAVESGWRECGTGEADIAVSVATGGFQPQSSASPQCGHQLSFQGSRGCLVA